MTFDSPNDSSNDVTATNQTIDEEFNESLENSFDIKDSKIEQAILIERMNSNLKAEQMNVLNSKLEAEIRELNNRIENEILVKTKSKWIYLFLLSLHESYSG